MAKPWRTVRAVVELRVRHDGPHEKDLVWAVRRACERGDLVSKLVKEYGIRIGAHIEIKEFDRVLQYIDGRRD